MNEKKERAELGFEPRTSYNLGIRPKARTANISIITGKNNLILLLPLNYPATCLELLVIDQYYPSKYFEYFNSHPLTNLQGQCQLLPRPFANHN